MNRNQLKWYLFRKNMQGLREIQHKLRVQTGEIMIISVWWLPKSDPRPILDRTPIVFDPSFSDLRAGITTNTRTNQKVNLRELLKEASEE